MNVHVSELVRGTACAGDEGVEEGAKWADCVPSLSLSALHHPRLSALSRTHFEPSAYCLSLASYSPTIALRDDPPSPPPLPRPVALACLLPGTTTLPLPVSMGDEDMAKMQSKDGIHMLESAIITWTRQIKSILTLGE